MAKIEHDKYYTPLDTAKYCIDKAFSLIGVENITHVVEPSAGAGAFSSQFPASPYYTSPPEAYDLFPEAEGIIEQDFIKLWLPYQRGRLLIGNPPFGGRGGSLMKRFYNQACGMGDYIAWILPISYLDNMFSLHQFNLNYSEDLGIIQYSGKPVHCCFNIYERPLLLLENKPVRLRLEDVKVQLLGRQISDYTKHSFDDYDLVFSAWGSVGKEASSLDSYSLVVCIKVNNLKYREDVLRCLREADWVKLYPSVSMPILATWKVIKYLQSQFPDLK